MIHGTHNGEAVKRTYKTIVPSPDPKIMKSLYTLWIPITDNILLLGLIAMIVAFLIALKSYPVIIYLVRTKHLMDLPDRRSSHKDKVPTLGGIGVFIAMAITLGVVGSVLEFRSMPFNPMPLMAGLTLLFFLGVKDDLLSLSPQKKLIGQALAALIVIMLSDIRILGLNGLFGMEELPYWLSVGFTLFAFVFIINAFNLIDGIDGLAGMVAILASISFGLFFIKADQYLLAMISFSLIGTLVAFLRYNMGKKLFMGDTGSMVIGFLLAFQAVNFLNLNQTLEVGSKIANPPILALAFLLFPIIDTIRVFFVRLIQNCHPFRADKNHIHHCLLKLGLTHLQATLLISACCVLLTVLAYSLRDLDINLHFTLLFALSINVVLLPLELAKMIALPKNRKMTV